MRCPRATAARPLDRRPALEATELISNGPLNSPRGMTLAPSSFGNEARAGPMTTSTESSSQSLAALDQAFARHITGDVLHHAKEGPEQSSVQTSLDHSVGDDLSS